MPASLNHKYASSLPMQFSQNSCAFEFHYDSDSVRVGCVPGICVFKSLPQMHLLYWISPILPSRCTLNFFQSYSSLRRPSSVNCLGELPCLLVSYWEETMGSHGGIWKEVRRGRQVYFIPLAPSLTDHFGLAFTLTKDHSSFKGGPLHISFFPSSYNCSLS